MPTAKDKAETPTTPRRPVGTNAYHCTPDTPQSVPADIVSEKIASGEWPSEKEWFGTPDAPLSQGEENLRLIIEYKQNEIATLIAERDKSKAQAEEVLAFLLERDALRAERDELVKMNWGLLAERDKLLKDRADLAKQIDNDTDCIAKLREADGLDIIPTLAAAYKEIAALKEKLAAYREAQRRHVDRGAHIAQLVERVSVLEKALEQYANMEKEGDPPCWRGTPYLARAALRTSEDAK